MASLFLRLRFLLCLLVGDVFLFFIHWPSVVSLLRLSAKTKREWLIIHKIYLRWEQEECFEDLLRTYLGTGNSLQYLPLHSSLSNLKRHKITHIKYYLDNYNWYVSNIQSRLPHQPRYLQLSVFYFNEGETNHYQRVEQKTYLNNMACLIRTLSILSFPSHLRLQ